MSHEEVQQALDQFAAADKKQMSEILIFPIQEIARTGSVCYKWQSLLGVLLFQLRSVLEISPPQPDGSGNPPQEVAGLAGDGSYDESCSRLYSLLQSFEGPPFTIQRICELLLHPHQHHKTKRKLLYALDKLLSVTTIVAEQSAPPPPPEGKAERAQENHAGVGHSGGGGAAGPGGDTVMGDEGLSNGFAATGCAAAAAASGEGMQTDGRGAGGAGSEATMEESAMTA